MKNRLKEIRIKKGLTQRKLADLCNISETQIRNYENNRSLPSLSIALKLEKVLDENLNQIFILEERD